MTALIRNLERQFLEAAPDAMTIVDAGGRIVLVNTQTEKLFGYSREELVGQPIEILVPDRVRERHSSLREAYAAQPKRRGMGVGLELCAKRKDGSEVPVEISLAPLSTPEGLLVLVAIRDRSDRREVEMRLRESEEKFRKMIEAASDPVSVSVFDTGEYLEVNQSWCDFTGLRREQVIGRSYMDLGQWANQEEIHRYAKALRRGERGGPDVQLRKPNGEIRIGSLSGALIQLGGRAVVLTWIRDVTERKRAEEALRESEERFRSLAAFAPIGIFRTDAAGRVLYTNPRWQQMAGLSLEQSLSEGWAAAIHPEDLERVRQEWERCTREVTDYDGEFRFQTAQGEVRWVHTTAAAVRSPSGEVLGYVGTNQDISERKVIEQLRSDLVRMLSHDLKNPLAAILGFTDILREDLGDRRDLGEAIDAIESSAQQAMSLALNFLEADRIDSGSLEVRRAPTSLNEIVELALRQQSARARMRGVELRAELSSSLPPISLDKPLVERVLTNLLSNAIKFSPARAVVRVATNATAGRVIVTVSDEGPGIAAQDRPRLFQRYGRGMTQRSDSTGLGLFIVRTIVEAHGGAVELRSRAEGGTIFEVSFPIERNI